MKKEQRNWYSTTSKTGKQKVTGSHNFNSIWIWYSFKNNINLKKLLKDCKQRSQVKPITEESSMAG